MRIRNISCTQFAGVRDRNVSFCEGINVICGNNESGKSTLVNLISRTLFQDAKLDRRKDKEFYERYFPAAKKEAARLADFVDGKITFEDKNGTYVLSKEWGVDPRCTLSTPDGVIRDQNRIGEQLKQILVYGEGVYTDMLFSPQNHADGALRTILDAAGKSDTRQELVNVISQAFSESDGISADAIERAIGEKIDEIAGKHWDMDRQMPMRKAGRWSTGLGEILKAYYAMEDAQNVVEELSRLETEVDRTTAAYAEADSAVSTAEESYGRFRTFASQLAVQNERRKAVTRMEAELSKLSAVRSQWPQMSADLAAAKALQTERENRAILEQYDTASRLRKELEMLQAAASDRRCPTEEEIRQVKAAQRSITTLENRLCGMNLQASVRMLDGRCVEIVSLRTGKPVDAASITEAVRITVPGVMEMELSPADVDVGKVEAELAAHRETVDQILGIYQVSDLQELEQLAKTVADAKLKEETAQNRFAMLLGSTEYEKLETAARSIADRPRSMEQIETEIRRLCGSSDAVRYITAKETVMAGYAAEYGCISDLETRVYDLEAELKRAGESIASLQEIPAEYHSVSDPEAYLEQLQRTLKQRQLLRETALTEKTAAVSRLQDRREHSDEDPVAKLEQTKRSFAQQKELLHHWVHIEEVFRSLREDLRNNPMQSLADQFAHYLRLISGDSVTSAFPDQEKLHVSIYSRDEKVLDYGMLSEGTKETVSLAFRLAVLDHLFPDGGVIVLDDPFTDMDADRTEQACRLIMDCAQRHQVIFLTCKEDYLTMLQGNIIRF